GARHAPRPAVRHRGIRPAVPYGAGGTGNGTALRGRAARPSRSPDPGWVCARPLAGRTVRSWGRRWQVRRPAKHERPKKATVTRAAVRR
ncbi:MAG: hypothetical protein QM207_14280, partial [Thermobispora sp.]|nr:hypothetical protein [Thermobispora sp.]